MDRTRLYEALNSRQANRCPLLLVKNNRKKQRRAR
jgi:hypothetical protein